MTGEAALGLLTNKHKPISTLDISDKVVYLHQLDTH